MAKKKVKSLSSENVSKIVTFLEENKSDDLSLSDVMNLAEAMAGSLESFFKAMDAKIYGEFSAIAYEISAMREEIAQLSPTEMRHVAIPEAGRELDAVVEATESATNTIMSSAEEIMAADPSDSDAYHALVNDKVIEIFEACSFQDITGQRISKVVNALNIIDQRVTTFVERLKMDDMTIPRREETEEERRKRELILHGPQHEGEGVDQNEVDAMMAEILTLESQQQEKPAHLDQNEVHAMMAEIENLQQEEEKKTNQAAIDDLFA